MKTITFASFKGGAGKTTAVMAVTSTLIAAGKHVALIDTDENMPLIDWREAAQSQDTWSNLCSVYEADDLNAFETAFEKIASSQFDYSIIDTRGGGSELNNACLINTDLVIIPSALTTLDMTQALSTFEHTVRLLQSMEMDIPIALLIQRVPVGKLTISQRQSLEALSGLPRCETLLHARDAYAAMSRSGLLHLTHETLSADKMKRFNANHVAMAMTEAKALTHDLLEALGEDTGDC